MTGLKKSKEGMKEKRKAGRKKEKRKNFFSVLPRKDFRIFSSSSVSYTFIVFYCGRVPLANAPGCTAAEGLLYKPWSLVFPTYTARCLHQIP